MKTKIFMLCMVLVAFTACKEKNTVDNTADKNLVGHWEETDPRDAEFQPITLDYVDRLFLETDMSWKAYRDDQVTGEGTYTVGHTDNYMLNGENLGAQDSIVFHSGDKTTVEYYIYDKSSDRLSFTGRPGLTGYPYKVWKRVK